MWHVPEAYVWHVPEVTKGVGALATDVFRAKGPIIYLAQAVGLGDTQTRDSLGLKAQQIDKLPGLRP